MKPNEPGCSTRSVVRRCPGRTRSTPMSSLTSQVLRSPTGHPRRCVRSSSGSLSSWKWRVLGKDSPPRTTPVSCDFGSRCHGRVLASGWQAAMTRRHRVGSGSRSTREARSGAGTGTSSMSSTGRTTGANCLGCGPSRLSATPSSTSSLRWVGRTSAPVPRRSARSTKESSSDMWARVCLATSPPVRLFWLSSIRRSGRRCSSCSRRPSTSRLARSPKFPQTWDSTTDIAGWWTRSSRRPDRTGTVKKLRWTFAP